MPNSSSTITGLHHQVLSYKAEMIPHGFEMIGTGSFILGLLLVASTLYAYFSNQGSGNVLVNAPLLGSWIPWYQRLEFLRNAKTIIFQGYREYTDLPFKILRHEIIVLPNKYVNEMRNLPSTKLNSMMANIENFQGSFSTLYVLLQGNLHTHVVQKRLTPRLGTFVKPVASEIQNALAAEGFDTENWTAVPAFDLVVRLIARTFARTASGPSLCTNTEWLRINVSYPENVFKTVICLRMFPALLKPLISWIVPFTWTVNSDLRSALRILVPEVEKRQWLLEHDPAQGQPEDLLQMLIQEAKTPQESEPSNIVHRMLILAMASVHTTSMACAQALYDLVEHPEYLSELRDEIIHGLEKSGGWEKSSLSGMKKLDSFMKESQRHNPPSLTGFKRTVLSPLTLSDGLHLPKGCTFVMPIVPICQDERLTGDDLRFDGLRYWRKRQIPGQEHNHQFATTDPNNMHFGHGKYGCPGRFLAANTIKIIMIHIILNFDVSFEGTHSRPQNKCLHEYIFPDPTARLLFRKRDQSDLPASIKQLLS